MLLYLLFNARAYKYSSVFLGRSRNGLASSLPRGFQHGTCERQPERDPPVFLLAKSLKHLWTSGFPFEKWH